MLCSKIVCNAKTKKNKTIFVHNMFWTCIFLVLKLGINEQSDIILWVYWFKNECFWHRFTCTFLITLILHLISRWLCFRKEETIFFSLIPSWDALRIGYVSSFSCWQSDHSFWNTSDKVNIYSGLITTH